MSVMGKHGVSSTTPSDILLGAGTYHIGLAWDTTTSAWKGTCIGATSGGGKITIAGEFQDIELDGALVKVKGLTVKQGGTASAEVNFVEMSSAIIQMATQFKQASSSDATGYSMLQDKAHIEEGDYIDNFGFVGVTADGTKQIIVIFEHAMCTSGFELEAKNKENAVVKLTLDAYAPIDGDLDTLPVKIYYPTPSTPSN